MTHPLKLKLLASNLLSADGLCYTCDAAHRLSASSRNGGLTVEPIYNGGMIEWGKSRPWPGVIVAKAPQVKHATC